jgi:adenosine deaminase/adenosine deaminase CECR1
MMLAYWDQYDGAVCLASQKVQDSSRTQTSNNVYNSIYYSFIKTIKKRLLEDLDIRFTAFEANFPIK